MHIPVYVRKALLMNFYAIEVVLGSTQNRQIKPRHGLPQGFVNSETLQPLLE